MIIRSLVTLDMDVVKKATCRGKETITLDGSPYDSSRSVYVRLAQQPLIRSCNTIILSIDNLLIK